MARHFRLGAGWTAVVIATCALVACSGRVGNGKGSRMFATCPASPNCVSTDARDSRHGIAPFLLMRPASEIWPEVRTALLKLPRTTIVAEDHHYLHAECRSSVFGFVDDLEIQLRPRERRAVEGQLRTRCALPERRVQDRPKAVDLRHQLRLTCRSFAVPRGSCRGWSRASVPRSCSSEARGLAPKASRTRAR